VQVQSQGIAGHQKSKILLACLIGLFLTITLFAIISRENTRVVLESLMATDSGQPEVEFFLFCCISEPSKCQHMCLFEQRMVNLDALPDGLSRWDVWRNVKFEHDHHSPHMLPIPRFRLYLREHLKCKGIHPSDSDLDKIISLLPEGAFSNSPVIRVLRHAFLLRMLESRGKFEVHDIDDLWPGGNSYVREITEQLKAERTRRLETVLTIAGENNAAISAVVEAAVAKLHTDFTHVNDNLVLASQLEYIAGVAERIEEVKNSCKQQ
jgi:hypothetical protein